MGASLKEQQELDSEYLMQTFVRKPVEFVRGAGARLYDDDGKEYRDFLAGIGVCSVGHNNPKVVAAIKEQANKLIHVSNYYYIEHRGELAKRINDMLAAMTGSKWRVFFANSGAEANEGAIKTARRWGKEHAGGAGGIITAVKSFHGRTLATLAATGQDSKQDPFAPLPSGFAHVPLNDIAALGANILSVEHDRLTAGLNPNEIDVHVSCEVGGKEHGDHVLDQLIQTGYHVKID